MCMMQASGQMRYDSPVCQQQLTEGFHQSDMFIGVCLVSSRRERWTWSRTSVQARGIGHWWYEPLHEESHLSSWKPRPKVTLLASFTSLGPSVGSA